MALKKTEQRLLFLQLPIMHPSGGKTVSVSGCCCRQIQEVEDRRKIDVLLSLSGTAEASLTYFIKELDEGRLVRQQLPRELQMFAKELDQRRKLEGESEMRVGDGKYQGTIHRVLQSVS